jgi:uncharacterized protein
MRFLLWLVLGLIVYFALRSKVRSMRETMREAVKAEMDAAVAAQNQQRPPIPAENMVACAHCHLYLPASEAIHLQTPTSEQFFCCEEHLRSHAMRATPSDTTPTHG